MYQYGFILINMLKKSYFIVFVFFLISCKSFHSFNSRNDKSKALNEIRYNYKLSNKEKHRLKNQDSVLFLLSSYKKGVVSEELTKRRLDSFFAGNYTNKELWLLLALDQEFPNKNPFEIDFNNSINKPLDADSYQEAVKMIKGMDSILAKRLNIKENKS